MLRRVLARVQARESVLIAVGEPGPLVPDIALEASTPVWEGVADGWGHLCGRRVTVAATGRRIPRPRRAELWLPGPGGGVAAVEEPLTTRSPSPGCARWADRGPGRRDAAAADGHRVVPGLAGRRGRGAGDHAGGRAPRQPGRRPLAGGRRRGRRHRPAPPPGPAAVPRRRPARPRPRPRRPGLRARRAGDRPLRPPPGGRRAGLAVPRRPRPVALLRRRRAPRRAARCRGPSDESGCGGRASGVGIGIADGRFAAGVAARRAGRAPMVVAPGTSPAFLDPLPVAWLHLLGEVDPELVGLFARMGLARLGDLAALPAGDVLARFGPSGRHAHLLAGGLDDRLAGGTEPPPERRVEQTFDDPVAQLEPLVFVGKHLADQLVAALAAEGRVCTRVVVTAETEHGERIERAWYRAAGLSAPAMVDRLRWQLDAWMTSGEVSAGVVLLRVAPDEVRGDDGDQVRLWGGPSAADERATRAVARLAGLVGDQGVLVPTWRGGRLPGDRYGWVPASTTDLTDRRRHHRAPPAAAPGRWRQRGRRWCGGARRAVAGFVAGTVAGDRAGGGAARRAARCRRAPGRRQRTRRADGGAGHVGRRRSPAGGGRQLGRAVAARRAVVGADRPSSSGPLPGRHDRRRRPPPPRRASRLVGGSDLRLTC